MTDCPMGELRDQLPLLASGGLEAAEAARVRAHVSGCADCRAELALLETLRARFVAATPAVDVAAITAAVQRATTSPARGDLRVLRPAPRRAGWSVPRRALAAAASLLLVGTLSLSVLGRTFGGGDGVRLDLDSTAVAGSVDSGPAVPSAPRTGAPAPTGGIAVADGLADLDAAALSALLDELDRLDATVAAEPVSLRRPIVETPGGS